MTDQAASPIPRGVTARVREIDSFYVMEVLARAKALEAAGRDIVHMELGEPDFDTPGPILAAGQRALAAGHTRYTPATGVMALREAIADYYLRRYGLDVGPERIIITTGSSGALLLAMGTVVDPGDEVLLADPGYPCNRHFVRFVDGRAVGVPVTADCAYQLTAAHVREHATPATRGVLVATPSNPTGTTLSGAELAAIHHETGQRDIHLLVDEIYQGLVYDGEDFTALSLGDDLLVINSFSKYFGMTGWRLGWLVAPEYLVPELDRLAQNLFISAPTISQYAALAAFEPATLEVLDARRDAFRARRDFLVPALRDLGFGIPVEPTGAFYVYADCSPFTDDSYAFCFDLLERTAVAVTPGRDFGAHGAGRHIRFSYTTSLARLEQGVERLARYLS